MLYITYMRRPSSTDGEAGSGCWPAQKNPCGELSWVSGWHVRVVRTTMQTFDTPSLLNHLDLNPSGYIDKPSHLDISQGINVFWDSELTVLLQIWVIDFHDDVPWSWLSVWWRYWVVVYGLFSHTLCNDEVKSSKFRLDSYYYLFRW